MYFFLLIFKIEKKTSDNLYLTTFNLLNGSRLLEHTVYKFQFYIYMKEVQSSNSNVGMHDCCAYLWATKENEGRPDFTDP